MDYIKYKGGEEVDFQYCIQQLYDYMNQQQNEILKLRKELNRLENEVNKLKEKPGITVERLEYKFDQLKVETLEGTLNIGLNPADLKQIEDVAIPTPSQPPPPSNIMRSKRTY
ncbi:spore germination protein GerPC [Bacillus sp. N9]